MNLPVVNHEDYFAKIGDDHKFPINKFGELANYLIQNKIVKKFHKPYACSLETLSYAHSKDYISNVKNKTLSKEEVKKIGFPLVDSVVQRSLVATGGTVLASKLAINYGISCNTAGGSHHANYDGGAGYCVFNDTAVAALKGNFALQQYGRAAAGNQSYGYFTATTLSNIERIDYANDDTTAALKGPMSDTTLYGMSAVGSPAYVYFAGGYPGVSTVNLSLIHI